MKKIILLFTLLISQMTFSQDDGTSSILFVLDISGSMSGAPLRNVKGVIDKSLNKMPAGSYGGLISFHGCGEETVKVEVPVSVNPHNAIRSKSGALHAQGGTDLVLALKRAEKEAKRLPGVCTNVIVLTDGFDTCNDETAEEVAGRIASVNTCNEVNVISMGLVENWEKGVLDDVTKMGKGKHKAKKDSTEVLDEVIAIIEGSMGSGNTPDWKGEYKDPDSGNGNGGGNKPPPGGGSSKPKEKPETATAGAGSSSEKSKNGKE